MSRPPYAPTVRAAAKVNLHLGVGAARDDGFHALDTVYQAIALYDDLTASAGPALRLGLTAADHVERAGVPTGEENIVHRAVRALEALHGRSLPADLALHKTIPVAGGLAGGSADAAAALVAVDRLHDLRTPDDDLLRVAAALGSDVPFSLVGGTARGTGRGELVEPVADEGSWWWVVVPSAEGLSTPAVYRRWDDLFPDAPAEPAPADRLLDALASGSAEALAAALRNDLEAAALDLRPELAALLERGEAAGALRGLVSGSGPTCLFLCAGPDEARAVAGSLLTTYPVVLTAHGPVAGAHVLAP